MQIHKVELLWFILGIMALMFGTLVYITERNPDAVYFLSANLSLFHAKLEIFGWHGDYLPTLLHSFALVVITAAAIGKHKVSAITITLMWMLTEMLFELAQIKFISNIITTYIPNWFEALPVLENAYSYFQYGSFNGIDLISIVIGSVAAYVLIQKTKRSSTNDECETQTI